MTLMHTDFMARKNSNGFIGLKRMSLAVAEVSGLRSKLLYIFSNTIFAK